MSIVSKVHHYSDDNILFEGLFIHDDRKPAKGCILIAHTWEGRGHFVSDIGYRLAQLGYQAFAIDMYGKGITAQKPAECQALMQPLIDDRKRLQRRINLALNTLKQIDQVDSSKIIAIGYCFGGLCVLDLARSGAELLGVVSFHGLLHAPPPENPSTKKINCKILVLHGHDDPMVPPTQVNALKEEFTQAKADWQVHAYGNTVHAFTNKNANMPGTALYHALSDQRAWQSLLNFCDELFGS